MVQQATQHSSLLLALKMVHSIPMQWNTNKSKDKIWNKEANAFFKVGIFEGKKPQLQIFVWRQSSATPSQKLCIRVNPETTPGFVNII